MDRSGSEQAMYVISVAAELAGMHPQTLRVYERKGLLHPHRTAGNTRRYTDRDIALLRRIQDLTQEGINLAGVTRVLQLEQRVAHLADEVERLRAQVEEGSARADRFSLVPLRDVRRVRRAMKSDALDQAGRRRVFTMGPPDQKD